jgi:hypothetical protein
MKRHSIGELNKLYQDGESADSSMFAEMRSNILLYSGDHYKRITEKLNQRLKDSKINESVKLKLTKNHVQVVCKHYINSITAEMPGVQFVPFNQNELRDQKEAELSQSVWKAAEEQQKMEQKIEDLATNFAVIGEMAAKVYFDPSKGKFKGYNQAVDEAGAPLFEDAAGNVTVDATDALGQPLKPKAGEDAVFTGQLAIEPLLPFNIIRKAGVEKLEDSPFLCIRNMQQKSEVKAMLTQISDKNEREEKERMINTSGKDQFKVFDATTGEYNDSKDQVMLKEYYFRPCPDYPEGYFYITTEAGIMFEGALPYGIFPIETEIFDKFPATPRGRSIIKPIRGPQSNINMLASKKYEHIITMSDDKVITFQGSKMTKGAQWAGIREFAVNGNMAPTVLPGRAGEQFESSLISEVQELYKLANIDYVLEEKSDQDPHAQIYRSLRQRRKYAIYVKKFERFLSNVAILHHKLAQRYLPDDELIKAVGKREAINIAEFRNIAEDGFNVKAKPMSNDIDSMMGKNLNIMSVLQYIGKDLPQNVKGKMLRAMPFLNDDMMFSDLTLDDENIDSDILALDRGEQRPAQEGDNHELYVARLSHRMKQSDFRMLPPQVQQMYQQFKDAHMQAMAMQVQKLKEQEASFIPSGGGMSKVDIFGQDGKRIVLPIESIQWLIKQLEAQGTGQKQLQQLDQNSQMQVLEKAQQLQPTPQQQPQQSFGGMPQPPLQQ